MLRLSDLLVHFDSEEQLILACDASPYGLGAVLSHRMQDGSERPVALHPVPLLQRKRSTHSLTRKHCPSSSESRDSTSTCTAVSSSSTQTTSHSCTSSMSQRQCHSWHLQGSSDGLSLSVPTLTPSSTRPGRMLMALVDFLWRMPQLKC